MSLYHKRGVSAQKEDVHKATQNLSTGLFKKSFCKIYPDYLTGDNNFVNVMHADGAGTKSIIAYLYWKETGDLSVWKSIAQDAIVMNLDDMLCAGIHNDIIFNSTIDRNKSLIPVEVLEQIIGGTQDFFDLMKTFDVNIHYLGGETADVGDVVRTVAVNGTMTAKWPKNKIISNEKINAGDVIVGLAGFGKSSYENDYNSGLGSNGLTSARHDVLHKMYADKFKESYDNSLPDDVVYIGNNKLTDDIFDDSFPGGQPISVGKLLLSPTRTFAPLLKLLLTEHFSNLHGLVHCSGGGQTKCLKFIPDNTAVIKDNLFDPPPIFKLIQQSSGSDDREMFQVFNMGCRMEIYTSEKFSKTIIEEANKFDIDARVIGSVVNSKEKKLTIITSQNSIVYT